MNIIINDNEMIGYTADIIEYIKNMIINNLQHNDFDIIYVSELELLKELASSYDNELVKIIYDYDYDYTIKIIENN